MRMENIKDTETFLFHFDLILNLDISLYFNIEMEVT